MKKLLIFLLFAGLYYSGFAQGILEFRVETSRNNKQVTTRNRIRHELVYLYTIVKQGKIDSNLIESLEFDSLGNVVGSIASMGKTMDTLKINYQFDPAQRLHRSTSFHSFPKPYVSITEYRYDSAGNATTIYTYTPDTSYIDVQKNEYNENSKLVCSYYKIVPDHFHLQSRYYYSEDSTQQKTEFYDPKGILNYSLISIFDKETNKKTIYKEDKLGKRLSEEFFLDSIGRSIKHNIMDIEEKHGAWIGTASKFIDHITTENYRYNPDGSVFEVLFQMDGVDKKLIRHYYLKD